MENLFSQLFHPSETTFSSCCWKEFNEIIYMWDYFHVCTKHKTSVQDLLCPIFRFWLCCTWDTFISDGKNLQPWFPCCTHCTHKGVGHPCGCWALGPESRRSFHSQGEEEGWGRCSCTCVPACWGCCVLCAILTPALPPRPEYTESEPWESATLGFEGWPQSPAANQRQGSALLWGWAWHVRGTRCPGNEAEPGSGALHS